MEKDFCAFFLSKNNQDSSRSLSNSRKTVPAAMFILLIIPRNAATTKVVWCLTTDQNHADGQCVHITLTKESAYDNGVSNFVLDTCWFSFFLRLVFSFDNFNTFFQIIGTKQLNRHSKTRWKKEWMTRHCLVDKLTYNHDPNVQEKRQT